MKKTRHSIIATLAICAGAAVAADYPAKPIRIIVPYAAGGTTDVLARLFAERLLAKLHQAPTRSPSKPQESTNTASKATPSTSKK